MTSSELAERIDAVDPSEASLTAVSSALGDVHQLEGWLAIRKAALTRRLSVLEADGAAPPAADVLARSGRTSQRHAAKLTRRADTYGDAPSLEQQRAAGRVSDEHADALAAASNRLDDDRRAQLLAREAELAERAAASTPSQFARHLRRITDELITDDEASDRSEHQRAAATLSHGMNHETGMGWIRAELHPDDYQQVARKLDAEVAARRATPAAEGQRYDQLAATALVALVTGGRGTAHPTASVAVLIDLETLRSGSHGDTVCEYSDGAPLPVATARRHACDAGIIPIVLGGDGQPLDVGRRRRHATSAQRSALRSMYRTCALDGCETSFDRCEIHHLAEWDRYRGPTDLANLLPVCTYHHHRVHEGRWRLQLDPSTRQLDVVLPNGALHSTGYPDLLAERRTTRYCAA